MSANRNIIAAIEHVIGLNDLDARAAASREILSNAEMRQIFFNWFETLETGVSAPAHPFRPLEKQKSDEIFEEVLTRLGLAKPDEE